MTKQRWRAAAAAALVAVMATGTVVVASSGKEAGSAQGPATDTAKVERGKLSDTVSLDGTLTYRGHHAAINQAAGTYTALPVAGERVACGDVFYRVDDGPVLLLCGAVPAYRDLSVGRAGADVRQLNENLHELGYDGEAGVEVTPGSGAFTGATAAALEELQADRGFRQDGKLAMGEAVFLPQSARIAEVMAELGGPASPGAPIAQTTSDALEVQVNLDASQQGDVKTGDRARIILPSNKSTTGKVERVGRVAQAPGGQGGSAGPATIPAYISLDKPEQASGLDQAPVQVDITTKGVTSALSVPVTAIVGRSGGGYAVEVVRDDGDRELVAVELGLFDDSGGRVEVEGDLQAGDRVTVPTL